MSAVRLYLRSRRLHVLAVVLVLLAVLSTLVGGRVLSLGSAEHPASMPYRFVLAALASSCVVSSLASPLPLLDGASGVVARARWLHLAAAALVCTALLGGADLLGSADGGRTVLTSLRSTLTWLGLALPFLGWRPRSLFVLAAVTAAVGPVIKIGLPVVLDSLGMTAQPFLMDGNIAVISFFITGLYPGAL